MPVIEMSTFIAAQRSRVFDLERSIDLHLATTQGTGEEAIAGVTSGLIGLGERVTWRARHFGLTHIMEVKVTKFEQPTHFQDAMTRGPFGRFCHDHYFDEAPGGTLMRDVISFASPLGPLGWLADALFVKRHLRKFLALRNAILKQTAESDEWRKYVS